MKAKRILAVLAAAAVCAASGVTAYAAGKYQLLTEPMSTVDGTEETGVLYDDDGRANAPLISRKEGGVISGMFDITQKDLKKWRSSGEFTYTKVNVDNFDGAEYFGNAEIDLKHYSDCPAMLVNDGENDKKDLFYNYANGSLNSVPTTGSWYVVSFDGYQLSHEDTKYYITNHNDGVAEKQQLDGPSGGWINYVRWAFPTDGKYIAYWIYSTNETMENEEDCLFDYNICGITREGKVENIYSDTDKRGAQLLYAGDNFLVFESQIHIYKGGTVYLYSTETDKVVELPWFADNGYAEGDADYAWKTFEYVFNTEVVQLNGNKMVVKNKRFNNDGFDWYLVEISNEESENGVYAALLSNAYNYMYTFDGETYLVQTLDGKWGYLNS